MYMKMIKLFAALSVVAMLGLGVSSCGGDDDNPAENSKEQGGGSQGGGGGEGSTFTFFKFFNFGFKVFLSIHIPSNRTKHC